MKKIAAIILILISSLISCDDADNIDNSSTNPEMPPNHGILEFHFIMPEYKIPENKLHRISLNLSYDAETLYRSEYFHKENVSDYLEQYKILLPVGSYYFDAVITCSCGGDTCLNGGFPGGRFGMKHDFDKFTIYDQGTTVVKTVFQ